MDSISEIMHMDEHHTLLNVLQNWEDNTRGVKNAFLRLQNKLTAKENGRITFKSRPGVSHSLRVSVRPAGRAEDRLFTLIDIIDDDPQNRWLSVCFYENTITDNAALGNLIPKGILGEDGYCFDVFEYDESLLVYLENKIDEAFENIQNP
jgi:hypothetical protein